MNRINPIGNIMAAGDRRTRETPGQKAKRKKDAETPLVLLRQGGDFVRGYTPKLRKEK